MVCLQALGFDDLPGVTKQLECTQKVSAQKLPLWDNKYFYIADNGGHPDLKVLMHSYWSHPAPGGMGAASRSKTITPKRYGEGREHPVRSMILLRAWAVHRAHVDGWATAQVGRARQFEEEAVLLERDIRKLQPQRGGLLGNAAADELLRKWIPAVVSKLKLHLELLAVANSS
jgi:hypothetical protein